MPANRSLLGSTSQNRQIDTDFRSGLVALLAILFDCLIDDLFELGRKVGIEVVQWYGRVVQDGLFENLGRLSAEGALPGGHLIQNQAE